MRSKLVHSLFVLSFAAIFARAQQREFTQRDLEEMFLRGSQTTSPSKT